MTCQRVRELLRQDSMSDEPLDGSDYDAIEEHMATCTACGEWADEQCHMRQRAGS